MNTKIRLYILITSFFVTVLLVFLNLNIGDGTYKYDVKRSCDFDVTYCFNSIDNELDLVIGDSLMLPIANYLYSINSNELTFLGSGSCPMIQNLDFSYSNPNCDLYTDFVYDYINKFKPKRLFILNNYYQYFEDDAKYFEKIIEFVGNIESPQTTVYFVEHNPNIYSDYTSCINRPLKISSCKMKDHIDITSRLPGIQIVGISSSINHNISDIYMDNVHIHVNAVPIIYDNLLNLLTHE